MREGLHKIVSSDETIVAISTPPGHSGIGVIRISGGKALAISCRFFRAHVGNAPFVHRTAYVGRWIDCNDEEIDEVVMTVFRSPRSYTGEDIVEVSAHGNPVALRLIVETA